jgi:riboflavin kinase / FMN adenylyltransferase
MWIEHGIANVHLGAASAVTVGAFDGVHRGHQALIGRMVKEAQARALTPLVLTFDPLPGQVLSQDEYRLLSTLDERLDRIASLGVAGTVVLPFVEEVMHTPARTFVEQMRDRLALRALYTGPDFKLGRNREGDLHVLSRLGSELGYEVHILDERVLWEGRPIGSSRIRRALRAGNIAEANGCLGYAYSLPGIVGHGDKRGHRLGFPTANLVIAEDRLVPAHGIYVCRAHLSSGSYRALTNVGTRPTFNRDETTVEAYLLDFSADIYGQAMRVDFLAYLRPEVRFGSVEALVAQMRQDEIDGRAWFAAHQELSTCSS